MRRPHKFRKTKNREKSLFFVFVILLLCDQLLVLEQYSRLDAGEDLSLLRGRSVLEHVFGEFFNAHLWL